MRDPNYKDWLRKDLWTLGEFVQLACGFEPDLPEADELVLGGQDDDTQEWALNLYAPCKRIGDLIQRSIGAGNFQLRDYGGGISDAAPPIDFIRWGLRKNVALPTPMLDYERAFVEAGGSGGKTKSLSRRERQKLDTQRMYKDWKGLRLVYEKESPGKTKTWYAEEIRDNHYPKYSADYIRKHF